MKSASPYSPAIASILPDLIRKDLRESPAVIVPSFLLAVTLFIIMQFSRDTPQAEASDFWFSFFVASSALFYRSFSLEHRSQNFALYRVARIPLQWVFWSHTLVQCLRLSLISGGLILCLRLFGMMSFHPFAISLAVMAALCPFAVFLGLSLKGEKEFLFSFVYFPIATPMVLAGVSLSSEPDLRLWWTILAAFGVGASFIAALAFQFFYDDFTS